MSYYIRPAIAKDIIKMHRLISYYAAKKLTLPRDRNYLRQHLNNYAVAICDGKFAGACGLRLWRPGWLEIISLAVKPKFKNLGIGTALIQDRINNGIARGFSYFFTLTMAPKMFERLGFKKIKFKKIALKVQADCLNCPKNNAGPGRGSCNEIPLDLKVYR